MDDGAPSLLVSVYLAKREDLKRYFTARLGSPEAAEDLVQDIYFKLRTAPAEEVRSPAAFLYRLGSNLMLDKLKQQRRASIRDGAWRASRTQSIGADDIADEPSADQALEARQRLERIVVALQDLSPACRRAFTLHKLQGLSHAETAAAMGVSRSAVEKHIIAAMQQLMSLLGPEALG